MGRTVDDGGVKPRLGENDLHVAGRTEMDGIAQSESYKRTSFCYLKERRRRRSCEGNDVGESGRRRVSGRTDGDTAALVKKRANRSADSSLDLAARTGRERVKILDRRKGRKEEQVKTSNGGKEETTQVRARGKNWIVGKDR